MIHRSLRGGIEADFPLADAWFGSKAMIRLCQEAALVAILRMKKNKTKYRVSEYVDGNVVKQEMDVKALYRHCVRKKWQAIPGQAYQAKTLDVELNLAESDDIPEQWPHVRLLFVRGAVEPTKTQAGKHDWAIFLCTDTALSATDILQLYAMRWAIEVYFKEAKQHLGLLKRAKQSLCRLYRFHSFNSNSILYARDCQTNTKRYQCRSNAAAVLQ